MWCAEIIGIIGTLLGTILGWMLNEFSKRGKLMIYTKWKESFLHPDGYGGFADSNTFEEARWYSYELSIDLYNSSGDSKIMREISIGFFQDRKLVFTKIPLENSNVGKDGVTPAYENVRPLTIPSKSVLNIRLHGGIHDEDEKFNMLCEVNRIVLLYKNERNKNITVVLKNVDYAHFFDFSCTREKEHE